MKKYLFLAIALLSFFASTGSKAVPIVDTGHSYTGTGGYVLSSSQWWAGKFSIDQPYLVTDVQGWIWYEVGPLGYVSGYPIPQTATAALYSDIGGVPGVQLYSSVFSVPVGNLVDWYGVTNQTWYLGIGTYWAAFEVQPLQTLSGGIAYLAPNPLSSYAIHSQANGLDWIAMQGLDIAMRVSGDNVVPIPNTAILLIPCLAFLGLRRKN